MEYRIGYAYFQSWEILHRDQEFMRLMNERSMTHMFGDF